MNTTKKKKQEARPSLIVNADINSFRKGTKHRKERYIEAIKPITDVWLPLFKKAASKDCESLILTWKAYHYKNFQATHTCEEPFLYAALFTMFNSVEPTLITGELLNLICSDEQNAIETFWYPPKRFPAENALILLGINTCLD